jgi:hypothetical protein
MYFSFVFFSSSMFPKLQGKFGAMRRMYSCLYRQCTDVIYSQRQRNLSFSSALLHKHELYICQDVREVTTITFINFSLLDRLKRAVVFTGKI